MSNFNKLALKFTITSIVISLMLYIYSLLISRGDNFLSWLWVFMPFLLVLVINIFLTKIHEKQPKASKILLIFFNAVIILFFQLFISGFTLFGAKPSEKSYNDIKDYKRAVLSISNKSLASHFPEKIPQNARNIELRKDNNSWFGSEYIYLSFEIDKKYIQNELDKYDFQKVEGPFDKENQYDDLFLSLYPQDLKKGGYKVYYLKKPKFIEGNYASGIAVKNNRILYFYTYPD